MSSSPGWRPLLRRVDRAGLLAAAPIQRSLAAGALVLDVAARRASVAGRDVHLTRTEFDLLDALARVPGQVVERHRLVAAIWRSAPGVGRGLPTRAVDTHVKVLRRKLGADRIRTTPTPAPNPPRGHRGAIQAAQNPPTAVKGPIQSRCFVNT